MRLYNDRVFAGLDDGLRNFEELFWKVHYVGEGKHVIKSVVTWLEVRPRPNLAPRTDRFGTIILVTENSKVDQHFRFDLVRSAGHLGVERND